MKKKFFSAVFILSWFLLVSPSIWAQALDKIVEGAKKEGRVRLGITLRWEVAGKPSGKKLAEAFQAHYPFIKVDFERVGGTREREKVFTEIAAGKVPYDVTVMTVTQIPNMLKANIAEKFDWRALGIQPQDIGAQSLGVNYQHVVFGITYNKSLMSDDIARKMAWEDCADPKWKRRVAMNDTPIHLEILWQPHVWGRDKTLAHARKLAANQTIFERSGEDATQKVALGEYVMSCGDVHKNYLEETTFKGAATLGFVLPEPVPTNTRGVVYIPRGAQYPNAARLWIVWSLSEEAQALLDAIDFTGNPALLATASGKMAKGKKLVRYEPEWELKAQDIRKEILEATGLPIVR
jgi:ABC-type Fe3+ transport system substrate-binding protein